MSVSVSNQTTASIHNHTAPPCRPCFVKPPKPNPGACRPGIGRPPTPDPEPCRPGIVKPPKPNPGYCGPVPVRPPLPDPEPCRPGIGKPPKPDPGACRPGIGKPPMPDPEPCRPCIGKPPKPNPGYCGPVSGRPDPLYAGKTNEELAKHLLDNFDSFGGRGAQYVTPKNLENMAGRPLTGHAATDHNIRAAREILKRPGLVDALDRHSSTGQLDGLIDKLKITMIINSTNPFKYHDDKQLAQAMLERFGDLKSGFWNPAIEIDGLRRRAAKPLTGRPQTDALIQLAREITQRSDLLQKMDNTGSRPHDGRIHKDALDWLSR